MNVRDFWEIGRGGCHVVYDTKNGYVAKYPKFLWRQVCPFEMMAEDVRISEQYFGEYLWPTEIIRDSERNGAYVIVQKKLPEFRTLTTKDVESSPSLKAQFYDIVERNERLYREQGRSFDFFGLEGTAEALVNQENSDDTDFLHLLRRTFAEVIADVFLKKDLSDEVSISNLLVVDSKENPRIVIADPTLTNERSEHVEDLIFAHCCNYFNKRNLERCTGKKVLVG